MNSRDELCNALLPFTGIVLLVLCLWLSPKIERILGLVNGTTQEEVGFNEGYCVNDDTELKLISVDEGKAYYHCDTCGEDFEFDVEATNIK